MPRLNGFSVCKMAREQSCLPIIMFAAKSGEDDFGELSAGMNAMAKNLLQALVRLEETNGRLEKM